jgi:hypothetical protein
MGLAPGARRLSQAAKVGVGSLDRLEALVANDALLELAEAVPEPPVERGGRPRMFPPYAWILFDALLSVYGSARRVEAELAHPVVWGHLRGLIQSRFPKQPDRWLPAQPMRRHHYLYGRTTWLTRPEVLAELRCIHQATAIATARAIGLLDPDGLGSSHPTAPAPRASSTTPPCAASTTRRCCATSGGCRSTRSPPRRDTREEAPARRRRTRREVHPPRRPHPHPPRRHPADDLAVRPRRRRLGIGTLTDTGEMAFTELERVRTHRHTGKGHYRWYNDYRLPDHLGGGTLSMRLHGNTEDAKRRLNRTENLRPIPPTDPDFKALYRRRNDAESINRAFDDTLWLRRAHSIGHERQLLNQLTHALMVNSLARHRHAQRSNDPPLANAA